MKIFYLNDTNKNHTVYIYNLLGPATLLSQGEGKEFNIPLTEEQIPFIKIWETGIVLISGKDK